MTKGCITVALVIVGIVLALFVYLAVTTSGEALPRVLGASNDRVEMLRRVPADVQAFYVVPSLAPLYRQMKDHALARSWIETFERSQTQRIPPFLLGDADVIFWTDGPRVRAIARPDAVRRLMARIYLGLARRQEVAVQDGLLYVGTPPTIHRSDDPELATFVRLASTIPGHVFYIQRAGSTAEFPPVGRPAVTAMRLEPDRIQVETRAPRSMDAPSSPLPVAAFPANAMISASAAATTAWFERLEKLLPFDLGSMVDRGALLAIYKVEEKGLLPRLFGVVVLPNTDDRQLDALLRNVTLGPFGTIESSRRVFKGTEIVTRQGLGYNVEHARQGPNLLISFDRSSIEQYLNDTMRPAPAPAPGTIWFMHFRPAQLETAVELLRDRQELSLLAPDLHDSIRDIGRWLRFVRGASSVTMSRGVDGEEDTASVTVTK
jgi:hypothetical protein